MYSLNTSVINSVFTRNNLYFTSFYLLDFKYSNYDILSLAQKLGIVDAPEQLLSDKEWQEVKHQSNARLDSTQPCVICKEDFGIQQQVITT
jgi:hypothetical protein